MARWRGRPRPTRLPTTDGVIRTLRYLQAALDNAAQDGIISRSRARRLRRRCSWWIARIGGHGAWSMVPFASRLATVRSAGSLHRARDDAERILGTLQRAIDLEADAISEDASLESRVAATVELLRGASGRSGGDAS